MVFFVSDGGKVFALDNETGGLLWNADFVLGGIADSEPICVGICQGLVIFNSGGQSIYAFKLVNGELAWKFSEAHQSFYYPTITSERVYIRAYNNTRIYGLDLETGRKSWTYYSKSIPHNNGDAMTITNNVGYFGDDNKVKAIALDSKEEIWQYEVTSVFNFDFDLFNIFKEIKGLQISSIIVDCRELYFICGNGYLYALN